MSSQFSRMCHQRAGWVRRCGAGSLPPPAPPSQITRFPYEDVMWGGQLSNCPRCYVCSLCPGPGCQAKILPRAGRLSALPQALGAPGFKLMDTP